MLIKYVGGRPRFKVVYNRKRHLFTPENDKTVDVQDQNTINYIFSLPNRAEFEAIERKLEVETQVEEPKVKEKVEKKPKEKVSKKTKSSKKGAK